MYIVFKSVPCPACEGEGKTTRPVWQAWLDMPKNERPDIMLYGREHGYADNEDCQNCKGTGRIETRVDLKEALQELLGSKEVYRW